MDKRSIMSSPSIVMLQRLASSPTFHKCSFDSWANDLRGVLGPPPRRRSIAKLNTIRVNQRTRSVHSCAFGSSSLKGRCIQSSQVFLPHRSCAPFTVVECRKTRRPRPYKSVVGAVRLSSLLFTKLCESRSPSLISLR